MKEMIYLIFTAIIVSVNCQEPYRKEWTTVFPCKGSDKIKLIYDNTQLNNKDFQFYFSIRDTLPINSNLHAKFASSSVTELSYPSESQFRFSHEATINARYFVEEKNPTVLLTPGGRFWYLKSLLINGIEYCQDPDFELDDQMSAAEIIPVPLEVQKDTTCGKRKVSNPSSSLNANPGDWPWHVALVKTEGGSLSYICGGTLLSKATVLTAANCVANDDEAFDPDTLNVLLGKHNLLLLGDKSQRIPVRQVILHPDYNHLNMDSDIALIILTQEAELNEFVQPACIWRADNYYKLPLEMEGTVLGWGFGNTGQLSGQLRRTTLPKMRTPDCVRKTKNQQPFSSIVNYQSFCVETKNGSSPCISDIGSGFFVFVPDSPIVDKNIGSYYIRGVASYSVKPQDSDSCDTEQPVLFTDVSVYAGWVTEYLYSI